MVKPKASLFFGPKPEGSEQIDPGAKFGQPLKIEIFERKGSHQHEFGYPSNVFNLLTT